MNKFLWNGSYDTYMNQIHIQKIAGITAGFFGGYNDQGQEKNEDGLYILTKDEGNSLLVLMDAHASNDSIIKVTDWLNRQTEAFSQIMDQPLEEAFPAMKALFHGMIEEQALQASIAQVKGETAFLAVYHRKDYIWWLSVGDNSLYLFHPEFAKLGQYRLNQRLFFQWLGQKNSLLLDLPCYAEGAIELRQGLNHLVLLTDGILEAGDSLYNKSDVLYQVFTKNTGHEAIREVLSHVKGQKGIDSCTVMSWQYTRQSDALRPTIIGG